MYTAVFPTCGSINHISHINLHITRGREEQSLIQLNKDISCLLL